MPQLLVLVSDLHLGSGDEADRFRRDAEFGDFCRWLGGRGPAARGTRRLVVLGDFLELIGVRGTDEHRLGSATRVALARLDRIAAAHPEVFSALSELVGAGWGLDLVAGNHDIDLLRPAVQRRVRELVGAEGKRAGWVRFHRWILHVPGVLYAEHGHQYHDINWFPALGWAAGRRGDRAIAHPPAACLRLRGPSRVTGLVTALSARVLGTRDPRRWRYRREGLEQLSTEVGLGAAVLREIDLLPAVSARRLTARLLRLARQARSGAPRHGPDLRQVATRIDGVLRRAGEGSPFYAFGHSHVAEHAALGEGAGSAAYLNPGTWSLDVRGPLRDAAEDRRCTFAVVERSAGGLHASIASWPAPEPAVPAVAG